MSDVQVLANLNDFYFDTLTSFSETTTELPGKHTFFSVFGHLSVCESQASCPLEAGKSTPSIQNKHLSKSVFYLRNCANINQLILVRNLSSEHKHVALKQLQMFLLGFAVFLE